MNRLVPGRLIGALFCATGASFLAYLVLRIDLRVALVVIVGGFTALGRWAWSTLDGPARTRLRRRVLIGLPVGVFSTLAYDVSKWGFSEIGNGDNPFEAIPKFGELFVGTDQSAAVTTAVGAAFHLTNGITFAIAYCVLVEKPRLISGVGFAMALEAFQLGFYPGWLNPASYTEFAQLTAFGHLVYGVAIAVSAKWAVARSEPQSIPMEQQSVGRPT